MKERQIPLDGTAILLYEKTEGQRTYSDHQDVRAALDKLLDVFEKLRETKGLDSDYTLPDIDKWLDDFHDVQMMVYDKELGRYKRIDVDKLKLLLHDQVQLAVNNG